MAGTRRGSDVGTDDDEDGGRLPDTEPLLPQHPSGGVHMRRSSTSATHLRNASFASNARLQVEEDDDDDLECWHEEPEDMGLMRELQDLQNELDGDADLFEGDAEGWMRFEEEAAQYNTRLPVQQAALYVRDSIYGYHYDFQDSMIARYKWYRSRPMRGMLKVASILSIVMACVQVHADDTGGRNVLDWFLIPSEIFCLAVFSLQSVLQYQFLGSTKFFRSKTCVILLVCTVLYFLDLLVMPLFFKEAPLLVTVQETDRPFLLRFYIRPVYAFFHFALLRETLPNVIRSARALVPVVLFLWIFLVVFSIYGFMLFFKRNTYFANAPRALYQMFIALTTANFPDVMIQGYAHPYQVVKTSETPFWNETSKSWVTLQRIEVSNSTKTDEMGDHFNYTWDEFSYYLSPFFFILFYLIGLYFLMSVAFAVVYNVYKDNLRRHVLNKYSFRHRMLGRAFRCLQRYMDEGYDDVNKTRTQVQRRLGDRRQSVRTDGGRRQSLFPASLIGSPTRRSTVDWSAPSVNGAERVGSTSRVERILSSSRGAFDALENSPLPAGMVSLARKAPRARTKGVDQYMFELLYRELNPSSKDSSYPTEVVIGSVVALLQDTDITPEITLAKGTTGIVVYPSSSTVQCCEVDFQGVTYMAMPDEILLVEPAGCPEKMMRVYFYTMDMNQSASLDSKQFRALYQMLQLKVTIVRDTRLFLEKALPPSIFNSCFIQGLLRFGRGKWLDRMIAFHIFASVVLMTVHFSCIADQADGGVYMSDTWYHFMYAEVAVGVVFDVETLIKVMCLGWSDYWSKKWNRYDFIMTVLNIGIYLSLAVFSAYYGYDQAMAMVMELQTNTMTKSQSTPDLIMIVLLGRLVRVVRIVSEHKQFRYILKTFSNILPIFAAYISVVFIVYFYFVSIGMIFLRDVEIPLTTQYSQSNYYALNFDSFYSSSITLWCIMIVNNWFVIVDGYRAAKGDWVIIYFVLFWLICVILLMNVVTALVVEVWGSQWELNKSKAVNIDNNPLAKRIHSLNNLTPEDGMDYYKLGLPPDPDGSRPRYKVTYRNYSHKVTLALERLFLHQKGFEHVTLSSPCE